MDKTPLPSTPPCRAQSRWYLLPVVDDMHTLQTDGHSHWFAPTPMQEALGWLVNLTMEEGTPGKGTSVSCSLQHLAHKGSLLWIPKMFKLFE